MKVFLPFFPLPSFLSILLSQRWPVKIRWRLTMGKEGFVVLPPAMCVLTLLEKCQNVASADRFASQYWLRQSRLSFEEQEKVRGERLCKYHYNNPVRVASVELITTPPKRARLDPAATGDDRPERLCVGREDSWRGKLLFKKVRRRCSSQCYTVHRLSCPVSRLQQR